MKHFLLTTIAAVLLMGCNEKEVNALKEQNDKLQKKNDELKVQIADQQTQINELEKKAETFQDETSQPKLNKAQLFLKEVTNSSNGNTIIVCCRLYGNMSEGFELQYTWCSSASSGERKEGEIIAHLNLAINKFNYWSGFWDWKKPQSGLRESPITGYRAWYDIRSVDENEGAGPKNGMIGVGRVSSDRLAQAIRESLVDGKLPADYFFRRPSQMIPSWVKLAHKATRSNFDKYVDIFKPPLP